MALCFFTVELCVRSVVGQVGGVARQTHCCERVTALSANVREGSVTNSELWLFSCASVKLGADWRLCDVHIGVSEPRD